MAHKTPGSRWCGTRVEETRARAEGAGRQERSDRERPGSASLSSIREVETGHPETDSEEVDGHTDTGGDVGGTGGQRARGGTDPQRKLGRRQNSSRRKRWVGQSADRQQLSPREEDWEDGRRPPEGQRRGSPVGRKPTETQRGRMARKETNRRKRRRSRGRRGTDRQSGRESWNQQAGTGRGRRSRAETTFRRVGGGQGPHGRKQTQVQEGRVQGA